MVIKANVDYFPTHLEHIHLQAPAPEAQGLEKLLATLLCGRGHDTGAAGSSLGASYLPLPCAVNLHGL